MNIKNRIIATIAVDTILFLVGGLILLFWLENIGSQIFFGLMAAFNCWSIFKNINKLRKLSNENYNSIAHTDN